MKRPVLILACILALLAGLAARAPLSVALELSGARDAGLDWRAAEGTIWSGTARGVSLHGYALGDVRLMLSPRSLPVLSPSLSVALDGPEAQARGRLTVRPFGGARLSGGAATLRLDDLMAADPRLRLRGGALSARDVDIVWRGGACARASGALETDALTHGLGGDWRGPPLSGGAACADGALVLTLAGGEAGEGIEATARLSPAGWEVEAIARMQDAGLARVAPLLGFAEYGEGWRYRWRFTP